MQCVDVLEDVGRFVSDEEDAEIFKQLVDIADFGGFDGGVLVVGGDASRKARDGPKSGEKICSRDRIPCFQNLWEHRRAWMT